MDMSEKFILAAYSAAAEEVGDAVLKMNNDGELISKAAIIEYLMERGCSVDNEHERLVIDLALTMLNDNCVGINQS